MLIRKPDWVVHQTDKASKRSCIYSIHVHPDGSRIATGGLDTRVRIWNVEPILDPSRAEDDNCHKLLCTMSIHNGAVLCVRWSGDETGRFHGWQAMDSFSRRVYRNAQASAAFGTTDVNHEVWRGVKYLRGHDSDVQDLAWSSDDSMLASCGVDGHIVVWDGKSFERLKKITGHDGFVKGITWDPVGKYLATQSDDQSLKIWRTSDWNLEASVEEPFTLAPATTLFRRLSWSPDGARIVAANAVKSEATIAAIVDRDEWKTDVSLVGHDMPIECTAFNPQLFYFLRKDNDQTPIASDAEHGELGLLVALGSQDRSISIWNNQFARPLCVATDLFDNNIYDISWGPDGRWLVACSQDGTIAFLQFEDEIKEPAGREELEKSLSKYGIQRKGAVLVENVEQLAMEEKARTSSGNRVAQLMGETKPAASANGVNHKAINGSNISTSMDVDSDSVSAPPINSIPNGQTKEAAAPTKERQTVTITKDGKKRVTPLFVRSLSGAPAPPPPTNVTHQTPSNQSNASLGTNVRSTIEEYDDAVTKLPASGIPTKAAGNKRKESDTNEELRLERHRNKVYDDALTGPKWIRSMVIPPIIEKSQIRLGVPKIKASLSRHNPNSPQFYSHARLTHMSADEATKLKCFRGGQEIWTNYLQYAVIFISISLNFIAVSCEDGSLHIYTPHGRRILPPIALEAPASYIVSSDRHLLVITMVGLVYTWDVTLEEAVVHGVSLAPVLQLATYSEEVGRTSSIVDAVLTPEGSPVILTEHGDSFLYHAKMKTWTKICDPWHITSEFYSLHTIRQADKETTLSSVMRRSQSAVSAFAGSSFRGSTASKFLHQDKQMVAFLTLDHIEAQLATARILNSAEDYLRWSKSYAQRLADSSDETKAEEFCAFLLGPVFRSTTGWSPWVVNGLHKHAVLEQILPLLSKNRNLQHLVSEYFACLKQLQGTT
ncbi:hypothetical protein BZG36_03720 [Bifiguratus adelaidae]|uniref:Protein HIR n=1 Tax=Bifiguratus adelaidae TaxID=1938954 RepID=A0A261XZ71_9FUNG|nr:hypothetical protein BZG36_03720 [Bifiguratus adelaidae]